MFISFLPRDATMICI